jgi:hypothetical protein
MLSATDFLPSHINELMNRVTIVELYRGSGRTSRLAATLLLGIKISVSGFQFLVSGFWFWFSVFLKSSKGATAKKTGNQKLETRNRFSISSPERLPWAASRHTLSDSAFVPERQPRPKFHAPRDNERPADP